MSEVNTQNQELAWLLDYAIDQGASDLHISSETSPMVRKDSKLYLIDTPAFNAEKANGLISAFIGPLLKERIMTSKKELDFSFSYRGLRLRSNVFLQKGVLAASMRILPHDVAEMDSLGLPSIVSSLLTHNQGLIIITGPTGHGKSTTLASMVNKIATERRGHIITIEDPIEFLFENKKSMVSQREVNVDTPSFSSALRAALREDPDVVLVGEMRDQETVEAALQMAETGHLVLTSLHTNSASQTANRILDIFPAHQQDQIRVQLSEILLGIVSQRLIPKIQGGRVLATEVLIANSAVRSLIREGKTHQLPNLIQTSASEGMISLDKSLAELVSKGEISIDDALAWSLDPKALKMLIY
jgi:twitching motility protein PilT